MNIHNVAPRSPWIFITNCYNKYISSSKDGVYSCESADTRFSGNQAIDLHTMITIVNDLHSFRPMLKAYYVISKMSGFQPLRGTSGERDSPRKISLTSSLL